MYNKTIWQDHVVDQNGQVIQQGTPLSAKNLNNIENGIFEDREAFFVLTQQMMQHKRLLADQEGEVQTINLTNSLSYPFNNSLATVSLSKTRNTLNYRVFVEVQSVTGGFLGNIVIKDKALNGFKIGYDGSATAVTLKIWVIGGMYQ
ncbi:hypothetical protein TthWC1_2354 [Thermoanaerobacter thermohydrosulfuricus WC1]|uniref:Uncharacterized protein n=1 Tax=Thermoanaerobacter thermohydrosulfuricus WC1 TaxID=1198630 RepID=M8CUW4_THETY|nr:hypothetical protein [Thermoanaerobacter thermohydrosulfuricus]EMT38148.1 hypothetical protein TthWC1_2354 [Thermoanaerobacter thermohydrosulfuricus WC1]